MYHTQKINQALNTNFSHKNFPSGHYTSTQQRIADIIKSSPNRTLSNAYIASLAGCSVITVIRATNKLHQYGLITKQQEHQYSTNRFSHRMKIDHINKKVVPYGNDIPKNKNKSLILVDSLFRKLCVVSYERAREDTHTQKQKTHVLKKGNRVNAVQKKMILSNRNHPKIKEMLNSPQIKEKIITPTIQRIADILSLDEKEQFKLVAFSEDALEHAFSEVASIIQSETIPKVSNRMEWVLDMAGDYCTNNNIKPDWRWYYDLCEILGIETKTKPRPLVVARTTQHKDKTKNLSDDQQLARLIKELKQREEHAATYGGIHGPSQLDQKTIASLKKQIQEKTTTKGKASGYQTILNLPLDERIEKLRSELTIHQERHACYNGPEYMKGLLGRMIERTKFDLNAAEQQRSSDESQRVPRECNTNTMDENSQECESVLRRSDEGQSSIWALS
jgi:hypothetical protein